MSITLNLTPPIASPATAQPGVPLTRAKRRVEYRERLAQKPYAFDVMKDARVARSIAQGNLLRQFMKLLMSRLTPARDRDVDPHHIVRGRT